MSSKIDFKICTKCNEEKDVSEFYKRTASSDGYCYPCKKCDNKRRLNLAKVQLRDPKYKKLRYKERSKRYSIRYKTDSDFREKTLAYNRQQYKKRKENNEKLYI